ncbi:MFS transporter [Limobrevibacterium gyesilva]|uniref:MFS transporter n=1 Tax=Limobrevibacterium gyesilva TaxID=2991712 RepID=A0AA41YPU6_9PROT|nr:MFS transporter [Limobrevibacterium gyesilva]MCW3473337.1 MFS transporter [Limobrevibacterium gyesilva]
MSRDGRVNLLIGTGHFLSHFYVLCLPPMFLAWQDSFDVSYAQLGLSVALMSGVTAVLQTPVGFLVDRYGARRFLVGGTLLMTLTIAGMGLATAFWQILALAALSGVGNSVIHPADYAILSGSVDKSRMGRAFAIHTFNGNLGFAAAPPVMAALMLVMGWRASLLLVGGLGIPLVVTILLQSRILNDQVPTEHARHGGPAPSGRELLMTRPMLLFFAFFLLSSMAGAGIQSWIITVLHQVHGMDLAAASSVLTGYMAGATSGTLVGGYVADRIRRQLTFASVLTVVSAALILVVAVAALPDPMTIAVMFGSGLALGASRTPRDIMVKDAAPPGQIGKVFGFVSAGLPLGSAVTPVPFGYLIDRGHPELVLVLVAAILLVSLLCAGGARAATLPEVAPAPAE